jgi:hypothetical protein
MWNMSFTVGGQLPYDLLTSTESYLKLLFLIINIYCFLNSASKRGSYNNCGHAKTNRLLPSEARSLEAELIVCKRKKHKTNAEWRMCPISFAVYVLWFNKENMSEICISFSEQLFEKYWEDLDLSIALTKKSI